MSDYLVVQGESHFKKISDACTFEMEKAFADGLGADVYTLGVNSPPSGKRYRAAFYFANSFRIMSEVMEEAEKHPVSADMKVGYIFAGYMHKAKPLMNPVAQMFWKRYKLLTKLDTIFLGTEKYVEPISSGLKIPMQYLPMAANVYDVDAKPGNRTIAVNGFGRQERSISDLLSDSFNRADSDRLYYNTNYIFSRGLADWKRYRAMFWQVLRQSELSMAFDQLYWNPTGESQINYVGPRWFESLAAGNVVVGKAPTSPDTPRLLDWEDATIDLPEEAEPAVQKIRDLLDDRPRIEAGIHRNLVQMNLRHDWRHRALDMLKSLGLDAPGSLTDQIGELSKRAEAL